VYFVNAKQKLKAVKMILKRASKTKKHIILIADDDRYIRALLKKELNEPGYAVTIVNSGNRLIGLLKAKKAGVIITDIYMDGKDGFEVISEVKRINRDIPIIVITGDNEIEMERKVRNKDIFAYFIKPLEIEIFKKTVNAAIDSIE
jgi:DNA-binding NtrC family response regulator